MKIAILNTSIATAEGDYSLRGITLEQAQELVRENEFVSAIGHQSTAEILTELLGIEVPVNRITFEQQAGQLALVFKINGRPPEGKILSREEIEGIGYKFQILERKGESPSFPYNSQSSPEEIEVYKGFTVRPSSWEREEGTSYASNDHCIAQYHDFTATCGDVTVRQPSAKKVKETIDQIILFSRNLAGYLAEDLPWCNTYIMSEALVRIIDKKTLAEALKTER